VAVGPSPPTSSPLSEFDTLDVIGERNDGGVDMVISTTGPLDASDATCQQLQTKLDTYLNAATHPNFANVYPAARTGRIRIFVSDIHEISERARQVVGSASKGALARGVEIRVGSPVA
jgi:hypothetical protein